MQGLKTKDVLSYATMPAVVPRVKSFFSSGFGYIAFLLAHVYHMARLLPHYHPYLKSENIGLFGFRHVISEALRDVKFSWKNSDQILILFVTLCAILMLFAQFVLLVYSILITPAFAFSFFVTYAPREDIAFNLLDQVFGVPDVFCNFDPAPAGFFLTGPEVGPGCTAFRIDEIDAPGISDPDGQPRLPFHFALHSLFRFYSIGLLLIAVLLFLYFIVVILVETTTTGTPFGQRFQNVWAPIRLIVALGLLVPLNFGLNSGQFIVLYSAKFGSGLATNGWINFNRQIIEDPIFSGGGGGGPSGGRGNPTGERFTLLAFPQTPDVSSLVEAMSLVHACAYAYHRDNALNPNTTVNQGDYLEATANYTVGGQGTFQIQPYLVKTQASGLIPTTIPGTGLIANPDENLFIPNAGGVSYEDALGFFYASDIIIRFGERRVVSPNDQTLLNNADIGGVEPLCGDIRIPVMSLVELGQNRGVDRIARFYYQLVLNMWFDTVEFRQFARLSVEHAISRDTDERLAFCGGGGGAGTETGGGGGASLSGTGTAFPGFHPDAASCAINGPTEAFKNGFMMDGIIPTFADDITMEIGLAWGDYILNSSDFDITNDVLLRGWGGAGIWYNQIAEFNGVWVDAVRSVPTVESYPKIMEQVRAYKLQHNEEVSPLNQFVLSVKAESEITSSKNIDIDSRRLEPVAKPLAEVYRFWNPNIGEKNGGDLNRVLTQNIFIDGLHLLLGTQGLLAIREGNVHLHPLAQLVAVGKGLVNSAVFNMAASTTSAFLGGLLRAIDQQSTSAGVAEAASQVFYGVAFVGLTAGVVLFYVLPFLPFLYFYFAVASWVKAIFEAMVGVPLWALAHMRIDGDGLPGDAAQNGYFLILEIFIRPILTVFGLLAAIVIFTAQVRVLNIIWDLVTSNAAGFNSNFDVDTGGAARVGGFQRNVVDQFFFTIIYTMICYILALSSFKLIDRIPDNILRWAGAGVSSFGDIDQDQVENLSRTVSVGTSTLGSQAGGAIRTAGSGLGDALVTGVRGNSGTTNT